MFNLVYVRYKNIFMMTIKIKITVLLPIIIIGEIALGKY